MRFTVGFNMNRRLPLFFAYFNEPLQYLFSSDLIKSLLYLCLCFYTERDSRLCFFLTYLCI